MVQADVKFDRIAQVCNLTTDELRAINPQYRRDIVPLGHTLRLPASRIEPFITNEDSIYGGVGELSALRRAVTEDIQQDTAPSGARSRAKGRAGRTRGKSVTVRSGDSLSAIAIRNGTTVAKLKKLNGMRSDRIRSGQKIRIN